jgi:hypothetical protein
MRFQSLILFAVATWCSVALGQGNQLVPFTWGTVGTLMVPAGFKLKIWDYREGTVTYLRYPDSSEIFLHHGFMMRIPILQGSRYRQEKSNNANGHHTRAGNMKNGTQRWREDQYKVSLNVGYQGVSIGKQALFDQTLDSITFKR